MVAQQAFRVAERNRDPDHPEVAASLNNLAALYCARGEYATAELLYLRSLAIWENALGCDYPAVATSLENLAAVYGITNRTSEAEAFEQRGAKIWATKR